MDHTQIQPVEGRTVFNSSHMIPCFKMVTLENSVRAINYTNFQRIQKIARFHYSKFNENKDLLDEFTELCSSTFTFVLSWDDPRIDLAAVRLNSRRVPAK